MSRKTSRISHWRVRLMFFTALAVAMMFLLAVSGLSAAAPVSGAIFTTESACGGTNINIFANKDAVHLDGGPAHPGAAGMPDGEYYVKVTEPNGTLLGTSLDTFDETPAAVVGGEFVLCYQLTAILRRADTDVSGGPVPPDGYNDTSNPGGEYKVWVSKDPGFANDNSKTDNFKVENDGGGVTQQGSLSVIKFYDANANGVNDDLQLITGWKVRILDGIDLIRFTPTTVLVAADDYVVSEFDTVETNWVHTTPNSVNVTIADGDVKTVEFGNLCLGAGGGRTLGFWSNKNGQATMNDGGSLAPELALLNGLCLRNGSGADADFANYNTFRSWLLSANATNMAYMLSAQLAAMELNIESGAVSAGAIIYAPGTPGANILGFNTLSAVVAAAEAEVCANPNTLSGHPSRSDQEVLKNALDNANNNLNFVQGAPCPFSFAP